MSSGAGQNKPSTKRSQLIPLAAAGVVVVDAAATHWLVATGHAESLGIVLALAPIIGGLIWFCMRARQPIWMKLTAVAAALGLAVLAARRAPLAASVLY